METREKEIINRRYILLRLIAFPFVFGLLFVWNMYACVKGTILFIRWGGEIINYEKDDKGSIYKIYKELKD